MVFWLKFFGFGVGVRVGCGGIFEVIELFSVDCVGGYVVKYIIVVNGGSRCKNFFRVRVGFFL